MLRGIHKYLDKSNWDDARDALKSEDVSARGGFGQWTPLHIACKRNPPLDIVESLIAASPDSLDKFDACNRLPIHYAADSGAPAEIIQALVKACPKSIAGVDDDGLTPLHITLKQISEDEKFPSVQIIEALSSDPSAVWIADADDKIPLHYAVSKIDNLSIEQLRALVKADYNTVLAQATNGMTALHLALKSCGKEITEDMIKVLLGLSEDGEEMIDENYEVTRIMCHEDKLPLHYACEKHMFLSVEIFQLLLERCPAAASISAADMGYPIDILEATVNSTMVRSDDFNRKSDLVFAYNTVQPYFKDRDRLRRIGDNILFDMSKEPWLSDINKSLWIWMCSLGKDDDSKEGLVIDIVESILTTYKDMERPRFLSTLLTEADDGKESPLYELASSKIKNAMSPYLRVADKFHLKKHSAKKSDKHLIFEATDAHPEYNKELWVKLFSDKKEFDLQVDDYEKIQSSATHYGFAMPIVPMIAKYYLNKDDFFFSDLDQLMNYDDAFNLSLYPYAMVLSACGDDALTSLPSDESYEYTSTKLKDVAEALLCLHRSGYVMKEIQFDFFCVLSERVMLRNTSNLSHLSTSRKSHYFGAAEDLVISKLPPEMIIKLNTEGLKKYEDYWRQVIDDFLIASEFSEDELRESKKFQIHLKKHGYSADEYWKRVNHNWQLWMKIRPRRIADEYYVIKCFRYDNQGKVYNPSALPYQLVEWNEKIEVWFFASFFFTQITGETLFHCNRNGLFINDDDFKNLFEWNMNDLHTANRFNTVPNVLARDFLRVTLTVARLPTMGDVLQHSLFNKNQNEDHLEAIQKGLHAYEKLLQQNLLLDEDLKQRTKTLTSFSMTARLKFEYSLWRQLSWEYNVKEVKHPASFIFLPYSLETVDGVVFPSADKAVPRSVSLAVLDILHYTHVLESAKREFDVSYKPSFQEYTEMNLKLFESKEKRPLEICKNILDMGKNAEIVMVKHFENYLENSTAVRVAQKLVSDTLRGVVDYEKCKVVASHAVEASKAVSALMDLVGQNDPTLAESMLNRQMLEICGGQCFDLTSDSKDRAYNQLLKIVKLFDEDYVSALQSLFDSAVVRLLNNYSGEKECYVYAIDEYTGLPLVMVDNPSRIPMTSDAIKAFIPVTLLSLKAHFAQGVQKILGVSSDLVVSEQNKCSNSIGSFSTKSQSLSQLSLIQACLNKHLRSKREFNCGRDILDYIDNFLNNLGRCEFFGLQRLCSPDNLVIWTRANSYDLAMLDAQKALEDANDHVLAKDLKLQDTSNLNNTMSNDSMWWHTPLLSRNNVTNVPAKGDEKTAYENLDRKYESVKTRINLSEDGDEEALQIGVAALMKHSISTTGSESDTDTTDGFSSRSHMSDERSSSSEMSRNVDNKSRVTDDSSERFYYSSTESERSNVDTHHRSNSMKRPTPENRLSRRKNQNSMQQGLKPRPGDAINNEEINEGNNVMKASPMGKDSVVKNLKSRRNLYKKKIERTHSNNSNISEGRSFE